MNLIPQIIRLAATAIIWTALTLILVLGNLDSDTIVWVTLILGIVAGLSTMYIWIAAAIKRIATRKVPSASAPGPPRA